MEHWERETLRYLGYGRAAADEGVKKLMTECGKELAEAVRPQHYERELPLRIESGILYIGEIPVESRNLLKNLAGCDAAVLLAVTLGSGVDVLLHRYNRLQMSKAVVMQAAAAAMLEDYCDEVNEALKLKYQRTDRYLRPRFSPGYGDFPLEFQRNFAVLLEFGKRIGISLTDSLLMVPSKSVTAVIGISSIPGDCTIHGCELCDKKNCAYRR